MKKFISGLGAAAILLTSSILSPAAAADVPVLKADSTLVMAKDGSSVFGTGGTIKAADLAAEFDGAVTVKDPSGEAIAEDKNVPTGSTVENEGGAVKVLIAGDANSDGKINLTDVSTILKNAAKWTVDITMDAADADVSGKVNLADASTLLKYIAKWDVRLGNMKVVVDEGSQSAIAEDEGTIIWADHGTAKYERTVVESTGDYTYVINAAKNEAEGATVYISPSEDKTDVTVSATDFVNCYGDTVKTEAFTLYYHNMKESGYMPDALMPTDSTYVAKVKAGESQGFYLRATTTDETPAGLYESTVSIKAGGQEIKRAKIYLNVWDFTLDDADAPRSSFGLDKMAPARNHNIDGAADPERYNEMYKKYYDFLLDKRICAYVLPYNVETPEADVYINDPRVNSFVVYGTGYGGAMDATIEQLQARYEKLKDTDAFGKAYLYCADEPYDGKPDDDYGDMQTTKDLIDEYFPGGKQVVPMETGTHIERYDGFIEYLRQTTDILCPKTYAYIPLEYYNSTEIGNADVWKFVQPDLTRDYGTYANFAEKMVKEEGKEAWWYFAGLPAAPLTTYHASVDGMYVRMSGFQMYQENVTGVLYYATTDYLNGNAVFNGYGLQYSSGLGFEAWGNGKLLFSGMRFGVDGPIGSVRLDYIRDSFEDYMYLVMAERSIGKEATDAILQKITRNLVDFDTDAAKMQAVRAELAEAIMTAQAK